MDLQDISEEEIQTIKKAISKININIEDISKFEEGTNSKVYLLNNCYTLKLNNQDKIKAELKFSLDNYNNYFQKVFYYDIDNNYIIYKFIEGTTMKNSIDVNDLVKKLFEIVNSYKSIDKKGYGYIYSEKKTWREFLETQIKFHNQRLDSIIKNKEVLNDALAVIDKYSFEKKLIHGDLGSHNFIIDNNKLVGIIDPEPIIGDKLYDLLFALLSNVNIIKEIEIDKIFNSINEEKEKLQALYIIVLYINISRCIVYHKEDINFYLDLWEKAIKKL